VEQAQQNSTWCETTKDNYHLNICLEKLKLYYSKKYEFKVCGNKLDVDDMECSSIFLSSSYFRHI